MRWPFLFAMEPVRFAGLFSTLFARPHLQLKCFTASSIAFAAVYGGCSGVKFSKFFFHRFFLSALTNIFREMRAPADRDIYSPDVSSFGSFPARARAPLTRAAPGCTTVVAHCSEVITCTTIVTERCSRSHSVDNASDCLI